MFYFPWHRHQIEGANSLVYHPNDTGKVGKTNLPKFGSDDSGIQTRVLPTIGPTLYQMNWSKCENIYRYYRISDLCRTLPG